MFVKASKPHLFPMAAGSSRPQAILPRFYLLLTVALSLVACTSADRQAVISTLNATNAILYGTPTPQSTSRTRTSRTPTPSTHSQASSSSTSTTTPRVRPSAKNCLSIDQSAPYWVYMVNRCSFGIHFLVQHETACSDWNCSDYVGPKKRAILGGNDLGRVRWRACASPGGRGDVLAMRDKNGKFYCWD